MGKSLAVFWNRFPLQQSFWIKNTKFDFFKKRGTGVLGVVFMTLKCRWLQTGLPDLKNIQTIEILLRVDCLRIFKILVFLRFF